MRILVVDDEPDVLMTVCGLLDALGHQTECAHSVAEARTRLDADTFDAVLSDVHMPRARGTELAEGLATSHPQLPVVLMTGDPGARAECAERWCTLQKPLRRSDLERALAGPPVADRM